MAISKNPTAHASDASEVDTDFLLKLFDPETDYETIAHWHRTRGMEPLPKSALPKLGVMAIRRLTCEPVAASWVYLDCSGTGICYLEGTVSRPGISLSEARRSIAVAVNFLKSRASCMGYSAMITFCEPALARCAQQVGFIECKSNLTMMAVQLGGGK